MKVLFVQKDSGWLNKFKKSFNGNYKNHFFDFRKSPRSAAGRFMRGETYDIVLIDYGWSVEGLKKQISQLSPKSNIYIYSQMQCKYNECFPGQQFIKKDMYRITDKLRECGVIPNDKHK